MGKTLLSFGHGFSSRALALRLLPLGWRVIGTTRSPDKAEALRKDGVIPAVWPGDDLSEHIAAATHILTSVAPTEDGDPVLDAYGPAIARRGAEIAWAGYLSTTGVYGNHDGAWVDETSPLSPSTRRGQLRVAAEAAWGALAQSSGLPLHVFRLAGIYGPGRGPFAKVRDGTARRIVKPGQVFSRIHVDDIAEVLWASINQPRPGAIYNVCDDDPAPPQDVLAHAARLLDLPLPPEVPFEAAQMSPMARSFYSDSKRVRNDLIKSELGVRLRYPDYRTGLAALLREEA